MNLNGISLILMAGVESFRREPQIPLCFPYVHIEKGEEYLQRHIPFSDNVIFLISSGMIAVIQQLISSALFSVRLGTFSDY